MGFFFHIDIDVLVIAKEENYEGGNGFDRSFVRGCTLVSKAKEKSIRVLESAIGSSAFVNRLLGSKRENASIFTALVLRSRGRIVESVFTEQRQLSIEDLKFTQM